MRRTSAQLTQRLWLRAARPKTIGVQATCRFASQYSLTPALCPQARTGNPRGTCGDIPTPPRPDAGAPRGPAAVSLPVRSEHRRAVRASALLPFGRDRLADLGEPGLKFG